MAKILTSLPTVRSARSARSSSSLLCSTSTSYRKSTFHVQHSKLCCKLAADLRKPRSICATIQSKSQYAVLECSPRRQNAHNSRFLSVDKRRTRLQRFKSPCVCNATESPRGSEDFAQAPEITVETATIPKVEENRHVLTVVMAVKANPDLVWSILRDQSRLVEILPALESSCDASFVKWSERTVLQQKYSREVLPGATLVAELKVEVLEFEEPPPLFTLLENEDPPHTYIQTELFTRQNPPRSRRNILVLRMTDGDFRYLEARWELIDLVGQGGTAKSPEGCQVRLEVDLVQKGDLLPPLAQHLVEKLIPADMEAMRHRLVQAAAAATEAEVVAAAAARKIGRLRSLREEALPPLGEGIPANWKATHDPLHLLAPEDYETIAERSLSAEVGAKPAVDENNKDTEDMISRRVVVAVKVRAPRFKVWNQLSNYGALADVLPAVTKATLVKYNKGGKHLLRQDLDVKFPYVHLSAQADLVLLEKDKREIQFRLTKGPVEVALGKFSMQQYEDDEELLYTMVKFAVQLQEPHVAGPLRPLQAALFHEVIHVELPSMLTAVRAAVEIRSPRKRHATLSEDFSLVEFELIRTFGDTGVLPTREELRASGRFDLERAIREHGGPAMVAARMGWKIGYKRRRPRGYWEDFRNFQREIDLFNEEHFLEPGVLPARPVFEKQGRYDLARTFERWGGMREVAEMAGLERIKTPLEVKRRKALWAEHVTKTKDRHENDGSPLEGTDLYQEAALTWIAPISDEKTEGAGRKLPNAVTQMTADDFLNEMWE